MGFCLYIKLFLILFSFKCHCKETELNLERFDDGPCIKNISTYAATNLSLIWFGTSRYYYVPIASARCYLGYAEALLGRSVKSYKELQEMKLRIYTQIFLPPIVTNYGFAEEHFFRQTCIPNGLGLAESICLPIPFTGTEGSNTSGIATSEDTVVYTDNETTIMFVRCINGKHRDFKVLTAGPRVDSKTEKIIRNKVKELGFNEEFTSFMDYNEDVINPDKEEELKNNNEL